MKIEVLYNDKIIKIDSSKINSATALKEEVISKIGETETNDSSYVDAWNSFIKDTVEKTEKYIDELDPNDGECSADTHFACLKLRKIRSAKCLGFLCGSKSILRIKIGKQSENDVGGFDFWENQYKYSDLLKCYFPEVKKISLETYDNNKIITLN